MNRLKRELAKAMGTRPSVVSILVGTAAANARYLEWQERNARYLNGPPEAVRGMRTASPADLLDAARELIAAEEAIS